MFLFSFDKYQHNNTKSQRKLFQNDKLKTTIISEPITHSNRVVHFFSYLLQIYYDSALKIVYIHLCIMHVIQTIIPNTSRYLSK